MKRSDALAPLSRDHHVALEAALRLRRATREDAQVAIERFKGFWLHSGARHFEIEETLIVRALPPGDLEWDAATARMLAEHADLRARAQGLDAHEIDAVRELGEHLAAHVRFEERVLFPLLEQRMGAGELAALGAAVESAG